VELAAQAQPKRLGLKNAVEGKTIALVSKYHGKGKAAGKATAAVAAPPNGSLSLDERTLEAIQVCLADAKDGKLTRVKLGLMVRMQAQKAQDPSATDYGKLALDSKWLAAHAEEGMWTVEGDNITLK
jgi:hypothetical protein